MISWIIHNVVELFCPPAKRLAYQQAEGCFSHEELQAIRKEHCVHVLSKYTQTVDDAHFLEWAELQSAPAALTQGLCNAVRRHSGGDDATAITLEGVIVAKAMCEKMDRVTAEDFAFDILDPNQTGAVHKSHVEAVILGCLELAMPAAPSSSTNTVTAGAIAAGACTCPGEGQDTLTRDGYSKLCKVSPALNTSLLSLLSNIGKSALPSPAAPESTAASLLTVEASGHDSSSDRLLPAAAAAEGTAGTGGATRPRSSRSSRAVADASAGPGPGSAALAAAAAAAKGPGRMLLPQLGWGLVAPEEGLLQPGWVWLLAAGLAPAHRLEWRLLYSSQKHGISFSTFLGRLGEASPTLLLIRDKGGALFGGIAHKPWQKTGAFYGDHASSVFSLLPKAQIFPASGINANIQWCGIGFSQLPNGIGFGGQVGHYGVWLDATMDHGMSRSNATFASPSLSSSEVFQVDAVEAWQLMPPEEDLLTGPNNRAGGSALQKAKEDQKILEWAGVGKNYSAALKDEPLED